MQLHSKSFAITQTPKQDCQPSPTLSVMHLVKNLNFKKMFYYLPYLYMHILFNLKMFYFSHQSILYIYIYIILEGNNTPDDHRMFSDQIY